MNATLIACALAAAATLAAGDVLAARGGDGNGGGQNWSGSRGSGGGGQNWSGQYGQRKPERQSIATSHAERNCIAHCR